VAEGSRTIGGKLTERFGQTVIVDNRTGAAGHLATELAARANPDGYTSRTRASR
jgi:tripartite-type tricarboxylate transporter receptor subunit TctC